MEQTDGQKAMIEELYGCRYEDMVQRWAVFYADGLEYFVHQEWFETEAEALAFAEPRKKNGCANVCPILVRKDDPRL